MVKDVLHHRIAMFQLQMSHWHYLHHLNCWVHLSISLAKNEDFKANQKFSLPIPMNRFDTFCIFHWLTIWDEYFCTKIISTKIFIFRLLLNFSLLIRMHAVRIYDEKKQVTFVVSTHLTLDCLRQECFYSMVIPKGTIYEEFWSQISVIKPICYYQNK